MGLRIGKLQYYNFWKFQNNVIKRKSVCSCLMLWVVNWHHYVKCKSHQFVVFNPWKVLWNWHFVNILLVISPGLMRCNTGGLKNEAFTSNPIVSLKKMAYKKLQTDIVHPLKTLLPPSHAWNRYINRWQISLFHFVILYYYYFIIVSLFTFGFIKNTIKKI